MTVKTAVTATALGAALLLVTGAALHAAPKALATKATACVGDNGGITLPPGFCATVYADNLGHVRHIAVGPGGALYANIWSGRYYPGGQPPQDGFLVAMRDTNADGRADIVKHFGETVADGSAGGTGVAVHAGFVYAEVNDRIVRYALTPGQLVPTGKPQVVLTGLPLGGDHPMHPFVIDPKGGLFVDLGSATNSCQPKNRMTGVKGADPCVELETRAGVWRYDANKLGQTFSAAERYAAGIRNAVGIATDGAGRVYATQHGRDQLPQNWPALYPDPIGGADLPSEELLLLSPGGQYGWPYCYYDGGQKKLVLAPEYGGDGGKAVGLCASKIAPVAAFPAHWAPNALAVYTAKAFPAAYQGGAFIAFHGSWNRAPAPQDGYNVVFQPLRAGKATGPYVVFADGFAGAAKDPGKAERRPMGLAVAADGALYIADDVKGRIWRVTYQGPAGAALASASARPSMTASSQSPVATPPAAGASAQVAEGQRLYRAGTCGGCHGPDGKGTPLGPDLTAGTWLWGDGSLASISEVIAKGVPAPKAYRSAMPAMGGGQLSPEDLKALTAYVWSIGHKTP